MVFHYTNFVHETNAWWCRRVRPLWLVPSTLFIFGAYYRYTYFGKIQAFKNQYLTEETRQEVAQLNKRNFGYNTRYNGSDCPKSRKRRAIQQLGDQYEYATSFANEMMTETRTVKQIFQEENSSKWDPE